MDQIGSWRSALFYLTPANTPQNYQKCTVRKKIGFAGSRVRGVREVGKGFVPARLDALKSPRGGLAEQIHFMPVFLGSN